MKKITLLFFCFLLLFSLTGCSKEEIKETLNEVLFVNKIISYIEMDMSELKEDSTNSNVPQPDVSNPFIDKKEETTVTSLDTFVYLKWDTYSNIETDLDLMALLVDKSGLSKSEYLVNFNNLNVQNNSVVHMGDDSKNSETIYLNLNDIPSDVDKIYLLCYFYNNDWGSLSKLSYSIDSLSEKYDERIKIGSINNEDGSVIVDYSSVIKLCVFERRGPIWHFKVGTENILDLNEYLGKFGIETTEYTSAYLVQKAKEEAERIESENNENISDLESSENLEILEGTEGTEGTEEIENTENTDNINNSDNENIINTEIDSNEDNSIVE